MQTWITDKDFYKSAGNLNRNHLAAQIYEGIHILASLLDYTDKLVNPKRNVKNHPAAKLWIGNEKELLIYICDHLNNWIDRGYKTSINTKNYLYLRSLFNPVDFTYDKYRLPLWITDELIQTHRSVLIQKEIGKEKNIKQIMVKYLSKGINGQEEYFKKWAKKYKEINHYRNLWPNTPTNLSMNYNWR